MNEDFASNGIILLGLFAAFMVSLGVCSFGACCWNWFQGRGFRE